MMIELNPLHYSSCNQHHTYNIDNNNIIILNNDHENQNVNTITSISYLNLPNELSVHIFAYLDVHDLIQLSQVSRVSRLFLNDNLLYILKSNRSLVNTLDPFHQLDLTTLYSKYEKEEEERRKIMNINNRRGKMNGNTANDKDMNNRNLLLLIQLMSNRCIQCYNNKYGTCLFSMKLKGKICFDCKHHEWGTWMKTLSLLKQPHIHSDPFIMYNPNIHNNITIVPDDESININGGNYDDEDKGFSHNIPDISSSASSSVAFNDIKKNGESFDAPMTISTIKSSGSYASSKAVQFYNQFSFPRKPNIVVDTEFAITSFSRDGTLYTPSLRKALNDAKDGCVVQIRRGSCIVGVDVFEINKMIKLVGETVHEYKERMSKTKQKPRKTLNLEWSEEDPGKPSIYVEHNAAFLSTAACFVEGLIIESGHDCDLCSVFNLSAFCVFNNENHLFLKNCYLSGYQGSCICSSGSSTSLIVQGCVFETSFYCIYLDEASLLVDSCFHNTFVMHPETAIGTNDLNLARHFITFLEQNENIFHQHVRWPEFTDDDDMINGD